MKCKISLCLSVLVGVTSFYAFSESAVQSAKTVSLKAQCLNEERIEDFKQQITDQLERNTDVRSIAKGACYAGGIAVSLLACYKLIKDLSIVHHDELVAMRRCTPALQAMLASQVFRYNDTVQAAALGIAVKPDDSGFFSTLLSWGSTIVRFAGQTALSAFVAHVAQQFVSSVFHEQSIKWLLHNKTLLPDLANQLQTVKADISNLKINKTPLEVSDYNQYVETLISLHNMTAEQLELVVGYMRYRLSPLPLTASGDLPDSKSVVALSNRVLFVAGLLNTEIDKYNLSSSDEERVTSILFMLDAVDQLVLQVGTALAQFELVEKKMQQTK